MRAYFIPGRRILCRLRYFSSHQISSKLSRPGPSSEHPTAGPSQTSMILWSCWQLLVGLCYFWRVFQAVSWLCFLSESRKSSISTCHTPIQPTAMLSPRRQGVTPGAPLACGARGTRSHPRCPSSLPSQPVVAHFKRTQWPQQQVFSQTCRPCYLPHFHQNKNFLGNAPLSWVTRWRRPGKY